MCASLALLEGDQGLVTCRQVWERILLRIDTYLLCLARLSFNPGMSACSPQDLQSRSSRLRTLGEQAALPDSHTLLIFVVEQVNTWDTCMLSHVAATGGEWPGEAPVWWTGVRVTGKTTCVTTRCERPAVWGVRLRSQVMLGDTPVWSPDVKSLTGEAYASNQC